MEVITLEIYRWQRDMIKRDKIHLTNDKRVLPTFLTSSFFLYRACGPVGQLCRSSELSIS